jgi:hypothetical protein
MTSELVSNAVEHARLEAGATIALDITVAEERVRVSVEDAGEGFVQEATDKDLGGWGLAIVEQLSDRWGIRPDLPHSVWFGSIGRTRGNGTRRNGIMGTLEISRDGHSLALSGELDMATAPKLAAALGEVLPSDRPLGCQAADVHGLFGCPSDHRGLQGGGRLVPRAPRGSR